MPAPAARRTSHRRLREPQSRLEDTLRPPGAAKRPTTRRPGDTGQLHLRADAGDQSVVPVYFLSSWTRDADEIGFPLQWESEDWTLEHGLKYLRASLCR